jgi:CubicO group peptidase (beta-lactamase class C family)
MLDIIKQAVAQCAETHKIPFVSFGATDGDASLCEGQHGGFDGQSLTGNHIFRIASMTKPVVTVAALQLVEAGKLSLDQNMKEILPALGEVKLARRNGDAIEFTTPETDITLHHLLTHTAGFGYSFHDDVLAQLEAEGKIAPLASDNDDFMSAPLLFEPGTNWEYGIGLDWVGKIIEAVTGTDLNAHMTAHIFEPLGMQHSSFDASVLGVERVVPLNLRDGADGSMTDASALMPPVTKPPYLGGGGMLSNVTDYLAFMRLLLNRGMGPSGPVLGATYADMMLSNQIGELEVPLQPSTNALLVDEHEWFPGITKRWSYGLFMNETDTQTRRAHSAAWSGLYCTYFFVDPASRIGGTVMMQMLPCYNPASKAVFAAFEEALYQQL